jgi:calcineurin-like phosphoesterase family protein
MEILKISDKALEDLVNFYSRKLVGKVCKRFEIIKNNHDLLKEDVKELIYESFRDFKDVVVAYNTGKEVLLVEFKKESPNPDTKKES